MNKTVVVSLHESLGIHLYSITIPVTPALTTSTRDQSILTLLGKQRL